jgi:hypothetical protein
VFSRRDSYQNNPEIDTSKMQEELIDNRIIALNSFRELQVYVGKHRISLLI